MISSLAAFSSAFTSALAESAVAFTESTVAVAVESITATVESATASTESTALASTLSVFLQATRAIAAIASTNNEFLIF